MHGTMPAGTMLLTAAADLAVHLGHLNIISGQCADKHLLEIVTPIHSGKSSLLKTWRAIKEPVFNVALIYGAANLPLCLMTALPYLNKCKKKKWIWLRQMAVCKEVDQCRSMRSSALCLNKLSFVLPDEWSNNQVLITGKTAKRSFINLTYSCTCSMSGKENLDSHDPTTVTVTASYCDCNIKP